MGTVTLLQPVVPFEQLPKRKREFIEEYVKTGDAKKAYLAVGYKDSHTAAKKAVELKRELSSYIATKIREFAQSNEMAILGLKAVSDLAEGAESEAVRLNAAKELLSRTIPEAPREVNHNHSHTLSEKSLEDLRAMKARLAEEMGMTLIEGEAEVLDDD